MGQHVERRLCHFVAARVEHRCFDIGQIFNQALAERYVICNQIQQFAHLCAIALAELSNDIRCQTQLRRSAFERGLLFLPACAALKWQAFREPCSPGAVALSEHIYGILRHTSIGGELATCHRDQPGRTLQNCVRAR